MDVVVFIPARFASTRLEGKPLEKIGGKPMIQWVYERAQRASLVTSVTVATDDERIRDAVRAFGGTAVMTSPDHLSGTDRVAEAARTVSAEIIVNLQGDEPLVEPAMIDAAVRPLMDDGDQALNVSTLKTRITDAAELNDPNVVKVACDRLGNALYFSRSPIPYAAAAGLSFKHIGLYVFRRDFLLEFSALEQSPLELAEGLEQLRCLENGHRIKVVETPFDPVAVDTPEDLERVRALVGG
jgi:3-deoxy-manno-octulosonate cytidylyltransferase (CMP-KDO synthetase)